MSTIVVLMLGLLGVLVMGASRDAGADARTPSELLGAMKATGWRAVLYAAGGLVVVAALVAGSASGLALNVAAKAVYGLAMVLAALAWHLRGLTTAVPRQEPFAMPRGEAA
ncbi:hypothetical protein ACGFNP_25040 [Nonomuraea sp. NPDC049269]|uniref:hypothetical protein n=1 Tax=Nonomuraea sp. NPDC049269 TaxID=3364349 RepID=UPI003724A481